MTITAKIVADSVNALSGKRITTMQLKYPRFIHAEFMTHRQFSRNASSSRAIPVKRQIEMIKEDTAMPIHWGKNQKGMQADEENTAPITYPGSTQLSREEGWLKARDQAISFAQAFDAAGYHKQIVNRLLEPFSHISVLVTATEWENFFNLRRHPDAQPEIHALADAMWDAMQGSTPVKCHSWHLPFISDGERKAHPMRHLVYRSVARCARVSYVGHDGNPTTLEDDIRLFHQLVNANPPHMSPAEHQALPHWEGVNPCFAGNFTGGWEQLRKIIEVGEFWAFFDELGD